MAESASRISSGLRPDPQSRNRWRKWWWGCHAAGWPVRPRRAPALRRSLPAGYQSEQCSSQSPRSCDRFGESSSADARCRPCRRSISPTYCSALRRTTWLSLPVCANLSSFWSAEQVSLRTRLYPSERCLDRPDTLRMISSFLRPYTHLPESIWAGMPNFVQKNGSWTRLCESHESIISHFA